MVQHFRASTVHLDSSDAESANSRAVKARRPHKKSRNGCTECKKRHIRCDERHPSCANCELAARTCSFPRRKVSKQSQKRKQGQQKQERPAATASPGPYSEVDVNSHRHSHSNANIIDNTDTDDPQMSPYSFLGSNFSEPDQAPERPSVTIANISRTPQQLPSPASVMLLAEIHTPEATCYPGFSSALNAEPKAIFTPHHIIVMHHASTVPHFTGPNRNVVDIAVRHAVDSPYLLDEVLAFTAFHMAHLYPESAVQLQRLATELQSRALTSFSCLTEFVPIDDKPTAVPRFLFSSILGRHAIADALAYSHSDFHLFIDRLVESFNLNRGIKAVTPLAREFLYHTELQPFLRTVLDAQKQIVSPGSECNSLSRLMDSSDLSEASVKACRQAIEVLQRSFDTCLYLPEKEYSQSTSVFAVRIGNDFVDVLRKHRPEALVIIAYFGVLLHRCRSYWPFGDTGASVICAIAGNLGSYWQESLAWPLHVLETERDS